MGDVAGKKLLHLQCHFGLDTLSWARLGAHVTGVDYAEKAITIAQALSQELHLDATFVCCNLYDLPDILHAAGEFDIVYTSYGVIGWLPDLQPWGQIIDFFHEHAFCAWDPFPDMEEGEDGFHRFTEQCV